VALALLTLMALIRAGDKIDIPRDEAIYFEASRRYQDFGAELIRSPSKLFDTKARDAAFVFNAEHPPLMKNLAAISRAMFAEAPAFTRDKASRPSTRAGAMPIASERASM